MEVGQSEDAGNEEVRLHREHGDQRQNHPASARSCAKITLSNHVSSPAVEYSRAQLSNPLHDCALGSGGAHQPRQELMLNH